MPNKVPPRISAERVSRLEELSNRLHRNFAEKFIGEVRGVLFESTDRNGIMYGYTDNYLRVRAPFNTALINTICDVKLLRVEEDGDISCEIVG
jgi:threonylcarbamoyladenosine tRNA methylthiotransferase MtaB